MLGVKLTMDTRNVRKISTRAKYFLGFLMASTVLSPPAICQSSAGIPAHSKLKPLFNGKNFSGFDILLKNRGINNDPGKVFQVEDGILHISGEEFGGLVTKK
jgi:hypothetical protein